MAKLKADIRAVHVIFGPPLADRADALWRDILEVNEALQEEGDKDKSRLKAADAKIRELKDQVKKLSKMKFGPQADRNQARNSDGAEPGEEANDRAGNGSAGSHATSSGGAEGQQAKDIKKKKKKKKNRKGRGKRVWSENLERRPFYTETEDKSCPCGCGGSIIGYDRTETLETIPVQHYIAVRFRAKYRCRREDRILGTRFEPRMFPNSTMSNSFMAHACTARFHHYLPWHRQEQILRAQGVELDRATILRWANRIGGEALLPIYERMSDDLKNLSSRLFMDETTVPRWIPGRKKTVTSYLYALHREDSSFGGNLPPAVVYYPRDSRARYHIHEIMSGVSAIVQTDAYTGYAKLGEAGTPVAGITPVKCWAHARRKFTDEIKFNKTADAQGVVNLIAKLYSVEKRVKGKPPAVRVALRQAESAAVTDKLWLRLHQLRDKRLPRSGMGRAVRYTLAIWEDLTRFLTDGRIDLDTNPVERMFKSTILQRNGVLFMASDDGAATWGVMSSIVETCKLNKVNVELYLRWVFDEISLKPARSTYDRFLPWNAPGKFRLK